MIRHPRGQQIRCDGCGAWTELADTTAVPFRPKTLADAEAFDLVEEFEAGLTAGLRLCESCTTHPHRYHRLGGHLTARGAESVTWYPARCVADALGLF